jgi:hypothetical protein
MLRSGCNLDFFWKLCYTGGAVQCGSSVKVRCNAQRDEGVSRLMPSGNRDRLVDCMEEFVKYTLVMRPHFDLFGDRYSEREEQKAGLLDTQNGVSLTEM